MADDNSGGKTTPPGPGDSNGSGGQSDDKTLSLEQALLAPLNSILKAQLHSARSFLNLLLQLGYPHDEDSNDQDSQEPYHVEFKHHDSEGVEQTLRVPALSLVPIAPLAIDSANFELEMAVKRVSDMKQLQQSRKEKILASPPKNTFTHPDLDQRPWFLVDKPLSIEGEIAPSSTVEGQQRNESQSSIKIKINVKSIPMPSGLDKLLTTLTHMGQITPDPDTNTAQTDDAGTN